MTLLCQLKVTRRLFQTEMIFSCHCQQLIVQSRLFLVKDVQAKRLVPDIFRIYAVIYLQFPVSLEYILTIQFAI